MKTVVIMAECPQCGPVKLSPKQVVLTRDLGQYIFLCPGCKNRVYKRADATIVSMLRNAGVQTLDMAGQAGIPELQAVAREKAVHQHPGGPELTLDDAIDFHASLDDELRELFK